MSISSMRIIGGHICRAWELLTAMMVMEAAFGVAGLIAAPIYYAYVKDELRDKRLALMMLHSDACYSSVKLL
ncbi:MAG: hypothetical protein U1F34_02830 [Gammaproteobacteria bacterium]